MRLGLILSEVGQGFRRNLSMVVSVVLVTFISLTFFGSAILLQLQIGEMKGYWYDRAEVTVYMCIAAIPDCDGADATQEQIDAVSAQLAGDTLGQFVQTEQIVSYNIYIYELKAHYETRSAPQTRQSIHVGGAIVPFTRELDVWDTPVPETEPFVDAAPEPIVIPGSQRVIACTDCGVPEPVNGVP